MNPIITAIVVFLLIDRFVINRKPSGPKYPDQQRFPNAPGGYG